MRKPSTLQPLLLRRPLHAGQVSVALFAADLPKVEGARIGTAGEGDGAESDLFGFAGEEVVLAQPIFAVGLKEGGLKDEAIENHEGAAVPSAGLKDEFHVLGNCIGVVHDGMDVVHNAVIAIEVTGGIAGGEGFLSDPDERRFAARSVGGFNLLVRIGIDFLGVGARG
jgi:hypothetical protein